MYGSSDPDPPVWLKAECLQPVGSFKLRGVFNWARSLSDAELQRGGDHPEAPAIPRRPSGTQPGSWGFRPGVSCPTAPRR